VNNNKRLINAASMIRGFIFLASLIVVSSASAGLVTRADFSGLETLETFSSGFGIGSSVVSNGVTYTSNSVLFTSNRDNFFSNVPDISRGSALNDNTSASDISVDFSTKVNRIGFYVSTNGNTDWLVNVFGDSNQLLGSNTFNSQGLNPNVGAAFVGFEFAENINYFQILQEDNGYVFMMDDLRYESVSNASAPSVLGFLVVGLFLAMRKRPKF
jgi:hypothetical protein